MFKFILGVLTGAGITTVLLFFQINELKEKEVELREQAQNIDPDHVSNYVWDNLVEVPEDRSGAETWFQQEYDALEWSWQRMVRKYDHMQLPDEMAADVLTFNYIPWVKELYQKTDQKDLPHENLKLNVLELRIKSLEALERYYTDYKNKDFDTYLEYDTQFREVIKNHPEIFNK